MRNIKKLLQITFLVITLLSVSMGTIHAEPTDINLTIRSGDTIIYTGAIALPSPGNIDINSHSLNAQSVLSIIYNADTLSSDFNISNLEYYDSFGSFYLKCITSNVGENCDNWQYAVNNTYPGIGMDQKILSGGETIYLYFGPQYKISLSSNTITTADTLTATTQKYDYQNNSWIIRNGITVGLTQPDPSNPFSPIEIKISPVDDNGNAAFSSIAQGTYNVGVKEDFYFPTENLTVNAPIVQHSSGGGGGSFIKINEEKKIEKKVFNTEKSTNFILSKQKEDGSFGEDLYTDWATISLLANKETKIDNILNLIKYYSTEKKIERNLTDYEREAMSIMTLGLNPYNIKNENYIKKITDSFDGKQFGEIDKDNDDIFALIVLQNAGYTKDDQIIKDATNFILSKQKENGSWDESVDITGASIQALMTTTDKSCFLLGSLSASTDAALPLGSSACETPQNKELLSAIIKAKEFLKQNQKDDGSFGNVSSTAWAIGGIYALSEKPEDWIKNKNNPVDYLISMQEEDGSIKDEDLNNKIWQTSYVITALSGKTWNQIMQKFEKPKEEINTEKTESIFKKETNKTYISKKENTNKNQKQEKKLIEQKENNLIGKEEIKESWFKNILNKIFDIF